MKNTFGFTLIEIMITVLIIAILASIAVPSYMKAARKSNRSVAKTEISNLAQRLQRCYTVYGRFNDPGCAAFTEVTNGKVTGNGGNNDFYKITFTAITTSTFTLQAEATKSPQLQDTGCTTISLDYSGNGTPTECW